MPSPPRSPQPAPPPDPAERRAAITGALKRYRKRLRRKIEALRGDLATAERGDEFRRCGETLLAYLGEVPRHASTVSLPDPDDPDRRIDIALDPKLKPQTNASRYFKRAAKAERASIDIPPRIEAVEAEHAEIEALIERIDALAAPEADTDATAKIDRELEAHLRKLPLNVQRTLVPAKLAGELQKERIKAARASGKPLVPARFQPRRLKTSEGWDVMIGRSNEGNDYLTHKMARGEDYWFHVHGAAGSHVILRRGKGKNEPSKVTIAEVSAWAAFYSQARNAGKVPVIVTRKKYVRKPRKSPPGLAVCEREKTVMVRPKEPPKSAMTREEP